MVFLDRRWHANQGEGPARHLVGPFLCMGKKLTNTKHKRHHAKSDTCRVGSLPVQRYNGQETPVATTEDQALKHLASVLVDAYLEQKRYEQAL